MPESLKIDGKMNVHIFCPTHSVYDGVADKVLLPTDEGSVMILKNRAPLFISVKAGIMWVYNQGMPPVAYYVDDGIAEVRRNICSVIAWGVCADEVNPRSVKQERIAQEKQLEKMRLSLHKRQMEKKIAFLRMLESKPINLPTPNFD